MFFFFFRSPKCQDRRWKSGKVNHSIDSCVITRWDSSTCFNKRAEFFLFFLLFFFHFSLGFSVNISVIEVNTVPLNYPPTRQCTSLTWITSLGWLAKPSVLNFVKEESCVITFLLKMRLSVSDSQPKDGSCAWGQRNSCDITWLILLWLKKKFFELSFIIYFSNWWYMNFTTDISF